MSHLVAVYGSLKLGFYNHDFLKGAQFIGPAETEAEYTMLDLGPYPGVIEGGNTAITVEVYRVGNRLLAELDRLEGAPEYYQRKLITLKGFGKAWFYVLNTDSSDVKKYPVVTSGIWDRE